MAFEGGEEIGVRGVVFRIALAFDVTIDRSRWALQGLIGSF